MIVNADEKVAHLDIAKIKREIYVFLEQKMQNFMKIML